MNQSKDVMKFIQEQMAGIRKEISEIKSSNVQDKIVESDSSDKAPRERSEAQKKYFKKVGGGRVAGSILMRERFWNRSGEKMIARPSEQGMLIFSQNEINGEIINRPLLFVPSLDRRTIRRALGDVAKYMKAVKVLASHGDLMFRVETAQNLMEAIPSRPKASTVNPDFEKNAPLRRGLHAAAAKDKNKVRTRSSAYAPLIDAHRKEKKAKRRR